MCNLKSFFFAALVLTSACTPQRSYHGNPSFSAISIETTSQRLEDAVPATENEPPKEDPWTRRIREEYERAKAKSELDYSIKLAEVRRLQQLPPAKIGMTTEQVLEKSSWGRPNSINRTVSSGSVTEQWVYDRNQYLYFRNGRLFAVQQHQ